MAIRAVFIAIILSSALFMPQAAFGEDGEPTEEFARAKAFFAQGKYEEAAQKFEELVASPRLRDSDKIVECYQSLGASYFYLKNLDAARKQFMRLLAIRPNYQIDQMLFPPDLVAFVEKIREELREKLKRFEEQQKRLEEERLKQLEEERRRLEEARRSYLIKDERRNILLVNFLPFGAGQIQNDQILKGAAFGAMQLAGLILNVAAYNFAESLRNERGYYSKANLAGAGDSDYEKAKDAMVWQYIGLGIFGISYLISVGDAIYHYEPSLVQVRQVSGEEFHKEGLELPAPATPTVLSIPAGASGASSAPPP